MTRVILAFVAVSVLGTGPAVVVAQDSAPELSAQAQRECDLGRRASDRSVRVEHFERGEALAEQALVAEDELAAAHFALFCNLGEQMRIDGESWNPGAIFTLRRVLGELDRTLELDPNHLDAISAKGTLLVRLPSMLGGDPARGETLLRHVIERAPGAVNARMTLARTYESRGKHVEAIRLAKEALSLAHEQKREDLLPEAHLTYTELRERHPELVVARP